MFLLPLRLSAVFINIIKFILPNVNSLIDCRGLFCYTLDIYDRRRF